MIEDRENVEGGENHVKKGISVLLVCVFALSLGVAVAEDVDLSAMTLDELIALKTAIAGELMNRDEIKEAAIPSGVYVVGQDIPVGSYSITTSSILASIMIYESSGDLSNMFAIDSSNGVGKIALTDGQRVELSAECTFSVYAGISFE